MRQIVGIFIALTLLCTAAAAQQKKELRVHFYDVEQGLAALVDLPNGQHILVDTGDGPARMGCGDVCGISLPRLIESLKRDLQGVPIDMMWITHQHADHNGGAPFILGKIPVKYFVDNGRDLDKAGVKKAHAAAEKAGVKIVVVDPDHRIPPIIGNEVVQVSAIVPSKWSKACIADANDCSIMLRIQYGSSSLLFTGDAEVQEENEVNEGGKISLLQVGHHGSNTSSSPPFLKRLSPKYAVISCGAPHEGLNRTYCHPRLSTVQAVTSFLGGPGKSSLLSYEPLKCDDKNEAGWIRVPVSDNLWVTARDGEIVLTTVGDGIFTKVDTK